jgi:PIN domain nuclease of toxin-antitoxin system
VTYVLDASALLAWLHGEPGGERVPALLDGASMSAVNWCEVVQKALQRGANVDGMLDDVREMGLTVEPFTAAQADRAAVLWAQTRQQGLSLGDRACIALAVELSATALTTDRRWAQLGLDAAIEFLR